MLKIIFPGNVMSLIGIVIPVVGFDVMETYMDWEALNNLGVHLFDFGYHYTISDKVFNQIIDLGFESFNALMILNTLGVLLLLYLL